MAMDIGAFNTKDVAAYKYAFHCFFPALRDFTARIVGKEDAEDLVEDLFLKVWMSDQIFKDEEHLKAFLYHSIKNAAINQFKKNKNARNRHQLYYEWQEQDEANYLAAIIRAEVIIELHKVIAALPKEKGRIIKMTYLEGKSNQETADELGLSIQTVKNQKLRGLALLKKELPGEQYVLIFTSLIISSVKIL